MRKLLYNLPLTRNVNLCHIFLIGITNSHLDTIFQISIFFIRTSNIINNKTKISWHQM